MRSALFAAAVLLCACKPSPSPPPSDAAPSPSASAETPRPMRAAAIAHAGVGSPSKYTDGPRAAVDAALRALEAGAEPIDAAVAGVVVLEDDPRFNAGTGAAVRLDGATVQMDASVMSSDGRFGAVANIEAVKNPVKVARAVIDTPHVLLAGDGATRFARTLGFATYDPVTPARAKAAHDVQAQLLRDDPSLPAAWRKFDWRAHWNYERSLADAGLTGAKEIDGAADAAHDTVGVAVRASDGRFAVALSTGGFSLVMKGRVGDVPILGAGLFAGQAGASAATGTGERVIEAGLARAVHGWLASGESAQAAADRAVSMLRGKGEIGIIVIAKSSLAAAADRDMAWAARESGDTHWSGPVVSPP